MNITFGQMKHIEKILVDKKNLFGTVENYHDDWHGVKDFAEETS